MPDEHGYAASKDQLMARLARIEGQVRGVARMIEQDRYGIDILTQISAIQAALDKVSLGLVEEHARACLPRGHNTEPQVAELMGAVGRMLGRG